MLEKAGGNWVSGEKFFDREAELDALTERARSGAHTLLTAQRRMGKTSLVRETLRRLAETGEFETVFVDLEHAADAADAIAEIGIRTRRAGDLWGRVAPLFAPLKALGERIEEVEIADARVKLRAGIDAGSWRRDGERIFEALAAHDRPVALAIDELPILVNRLLKGPEGRRVAELFLSVLRKHAQAHKGRVVMIVSGSVGLEPILRRAGLSAHANVFPRYELKPWTEEVASACLAALAQKYGVGLPEDVRRGMCRRLRCCVPHHVQQFFDLLHEDLRRRSQSDAGPDDVDRVYRTDMLGSAGQIDLDHYEQRLKEVLGKDGYRIALEILTDAAVHGGRLSDDALGRYRTRFASPPDSDPAGGVSNVMEVLRHDGYLARTPGGHRFVSGWLEDWWRARHGDGFVPAWKR